MRRELAGLHTDDVAARVDRHQGRPRAHGVGTPEPELPVVDGRMDCVEPDRGVTNARRLALGGVFAAMDTDDGDLIGVPRFELPQLQEDVHAVDSAIGPEVQQQQLAAEVRERALLAAGVNPVERV